MRDTVLDELGGMFYLILKDLKAYYFKPPNISWGLIFPLAWTGMFFVRSGSGLESIPTLLPGVVAVYVVTGEYDAVVHVAVRDKRELSSLIKAILAMPFVGRTVTKVVLNKVKEELSYVPRSLAAGGRGAEGEPRLGEALRLSLRAG